jgi:hypothetical protein
LEQPYAGLLFAHTDRSRNIGSLASKHERKWSAGGPGLLQLIRPHIGAAATALGVDEVGLDIRERARARLSAAL